MAYIGKTPSQATRARYYFTATGGETSLSGADDNANTLVFSDGNYVDVMLNGVTLVAGTDYNTTTANTIGGLTALTASDIVEVVVYDTFSVFGGDVKGNFSVQNGNLSVSNGDVILGDNDKAIFGTASDGLQIYNTASGDKIINETGSGNLKVQGDNLYLQNSAGTENHVIALTGGAVTLHHNASAKLATTATGIDVTGTVTADGLTVDGDVNVTSALPKIQFTDTTGSYQSRLILNDTEIQLDNQSTGGIRLRTDNYKSRFLLASNGDISFYEDTGNTPKFFWDASAESLGIGTTSPSFSLDIETSNGTQAKFEHTDGVNTVVKFVTTGGEAAIGNNDDDLVFYNTSSITEAMRITSSGNVGIGTTAPASLLQIRNSGTGLPVTSGTTQTYGNIRTGGAGSNVVLDIGNAGATGAWLQVANQINLAVEAPLLLNPNGGNVGIGTSSPSSYYSQELVVSTSDNGGITLANTDTTHSSYIMFADGTSGAQQYAGQFGYDHNTDSMVFHTNVSERMRIDSSGNVGIGTSSPVTPLHLTGANDDINGQLMVRVSGSADAQVSLQTASNGRGFYIDESDSNKFKLYGGGGKGVAEFIIDNTGNVTINGSLSKSSGSFRIPHPVASKSETHHLVHSFVEAPQADNIYRGKVNLVDGTATVNIDTVAGMTEGTFDALNREVQCFTSNESGWTAVRGSVSGNILTIEAQDNTCTDTISWMVVGERKDQHMYDTEWTDENGKVIVEPLKETEI